MPDAQCSVQRNEDFSNTHLTDRPRGPIFYGEDLFAAGAAIAIETEGLARWLSHFRADATAEGRL